MSWVQITSLYIIELSMDKLLPIRAAPKLKTDILVKFLFLEKVYNIFNNTVRSYEKMYGRIQGWHSKVPPPPFLGQYIHI